MKLQKWEYLDVSYSSGITYEELGSEGWELVVAIQWLDKTRLIFKRPLETGINVMDRRNHR
jgi:hypothetical protein